MNKFLLILLLISSFAYAGVGGGGIVGNGSKMSPGNTGISKDDSAPAPTSAQPAATPVPTAPPKNNS
jgi:hypothetical protein